MEITRHSTGTQLTLHLKGRLDGTWSQHTSDTLTATLEEGWHHLRLDLSAVTFLSSAGIRSLMIHYKRLAELKGHLAVINPSPAVRDVLTLSGLAPLLSEPPPLSADSTVAPAAPLTAQPFGTHGSFTAHPLASGACLRATLLSPSAPISPAPDTLCLGLGALGKEPGSTHGEFLALGGAALCQPANGDQNVDYLLTQGHLQPHITPLSGISARGAFSHCLRFETLTPHHGIPLSELLELALCETAAPAVGLAFAAETEHLVGAALLSPPVSPTAPLTLQPFPAIRDQMLFTAEPAHPRSLTLGVAFACRHPDHALAPQLRPLGSLLAHTHAASFPYHPLPKTDLQLPAFTAELLHRTPPLGLLHLLHDHRPCGLGESRFYRGALWISPIA